MGRSLRFLGLRWACIGWIGVLGAAQLGCGAILGLDDGKPEEDADISETAGPIDGAGGGPEGATDGAAVDGGADAPPPDGGADGSSSQDAAARRDGGDAEAG